MMSRWWLAGLFLQLCISGTANATTYEPIVVQGYVYDLETFQPLNQHKVYLRGYNGSLIPGFDSAVTNSNGTFSFGSVLCKKYGHISIDIWTYDCNHVKHTKHFYQFQPALTVNFGICNPHPVECAPEFSWSLHPALPYHVQFTDISTGNQLQRRWSFGDGAQSALQHPQHTYTQSGSYTVTLEVWDSITGLPCYNAITKTIILNSVSFCNLGGQVFCGLFPQQAGYVLLYRQIPGGYFTMDSCSLNTNGVYYFYHMPQGQYLVKAFPIPTSAQDLCFPTYTGNTTQWVQADPIDLHEDLFTADIILKPLSVPATGSGQISGTVLESIAGTMVPAGRVQVMLASSAAKDLIYTLSDEQGQFSFSQLPYGSYWLYSEIPGLTPIMKGVELTAAQPVANDVNIMIASPTIGIEEPKALSAVNLYPNPASDLISVDFSLATSATLHIRIYDLLGKIQAEHTEVFTRGPNQCILSLGHLKDGLYLVQIFHNHSLLLHTKVMKIQ